MKRPSWTLVWALLLSAALAGCGAEPPGVSRALGEVGFDKAFQASRVVIARYYSIDSADPESGLIVCRPEYVKGGTDRLLGSTPTRELARLQLRRYGRQVIAYAQVTLQRQMLTAQREMESGHTYSGVPDDTPSETFAATTAQQNTSWSTVKYDHVRENAILDDLVDALAKTPATRPASSASSTNPADPKNLSSHKS